MPTPTQKLRDPPAPGVIVSKSSSLKKRFFRRRAILIVVGLVVLAGALIVGNHYRTMLKAKQAINYQAVAFLLNDNNCTARAMQSVSAERPDPKNIKGSITLLSYRASCLTQTGKYKDANKVLQQLRPYYVKAGDTAAAKRVDDQIAANNDSIAHPLTHIIKIPPDISPQDDQKINKFFGNSQ